MVGKLTMSPFCNLDNYELTLFCDLTWFPSWRVRWNRRVWCVWLCVYPLLLYFEEVNEDLRPIRSIADQSQVRQRLLRTALFFLDLWELIRCTARHGDRACNHSGWVSKQLCVRCSAVWCAYRGKWETFHNLFADDMEVSIYRPNWNSSLKVWL